MSSLEMFRIKTQWYDSWIEHKRSWFRYFECYMSYLEMFSM